MGFLSKLFGTSSEKEIKTMSNVKLAVIYYSMGGTNYQLSQWAAEGAKEAGAEVKVLKVPERAPSSHRRKSSLECPC
jgi:NAD(P)H dehydrogenase (quinone)